MIKIPVLKTSDKIKVEFENFLGQVIVVTGIVRRIEGNDILGNDITDGVPFFVSLDEILEINHKSILSGSVMESLKEVS